MSKNSSPARLRIMRRSLPACAGACHARIQGHSRAVMQSPARVIYAPKGAVMDLGLLLVLFAAGTLLMRVASALHHAGMVRSKNSSSALMRSTADLILATLAFWAIGYAVFNTPQLNFIRFFPT